MNFKLTMFALLLLPLITLDGHAKDHDKGLAQKVESLEQKVMEMSEKLDKIEERLSNIKTDNAGFGQTGPFGYIEIIGRGEEKVIVDGEFIGNAPVTYQAKPGTYAVEIRHPKTNKLIKEQNITVADTKTETVKLSN